MLPERIYLLFSYQNRFYTNIYIAILHYPQKILLDRSRILSILKVQFAETYREDFSRRIGKSKNRFFLRDSLNQRNHNFISGLKRLVGFNPQNKME
jgi:hypothetical protein